MGKPNKAHLHVIDAGGEQKADRREDDSVVTYLSVLRDMAYGAGAAVFGVSMIALAGAVFSWAPAVPSLGDNPWLSGSQNVVSVAALVLAVAAFAVPVHVAIWLPAKVLFAADYLRRKAEAFVANIKNRIELLTTIAVAVALVGLVAFALADVLRAHISHSSAPKSASTPQAVSLPAKRRPFMAATAPPLEPIAVVAPYHSQYLRFFQRRARRAAIVVKHRRHH